MKNNTDIKTFMQTPKIYKEDCTIKNSYLDSKNPFGIRYLASLGEPDSYQINKNDILTAMKFDDHG